MSNDLSELHGGEWSADAGHHESHQHVHGHDSLAEQDHDHEHPHGHEDHICGTKCETAQQEANMLADELFDDKKESCGHGSECKCSTDEANKLAEELFADNKPAQDQHNHPHGHEGHICGTECETAQQEANKLADELFGEDEAPKPEADSSIMNPITTTNQAGADIEAGAIDSSPVAKTQNVVDAISKDANQEKSVPNRKDDSREAQVSADESDVARPNYRQNTLSQKPDQDELRSLHEFKPVDHSAEAVADRVPEVVPLANLEIEYEAQLQETKTPTEFVEAMSEEEPSLELPVTDPEVIDDELEVLEEGLVLELWDGVEQAEILDDPEIDISEADTLSPVLDFDAEADTASSLEEGEESPDDGGVDYFGKESDLQTQLLRQELAQAVKVLSHEDKSLVEDLAEELIAGTEAIDILGAKNLSSTELNEKITQLSELLGVEIDQLDELIDDINGDESNMQRIRDILVGLRKDLSAEYSFEFPQSFVSATINDVREMTRVLGKFTLYVFALGFMRNRA
jgi:hypothetical protein